MAKDQFADVLESCSLMAEDQCADGPGEPIVDGPKIKFAGLEMRLLLV